MVAHAHKFLIGQPALDLNGDGADVLAGSQDTADASAELLRMGIRTQVCHRRRSGSVSAVQNRMKPTQARGECVAWATMARSCSETRWPTHQLVARVTPTVMKPTTGRMFMCSLPSAQRDGVSQPKEG
jgi:hypothetical protein